MTRVGAVIAFAAALAVSAIPLASSAQADVLVGSPGTATAGGNAFPFGNYSGEYQQAYASSLFTSPITISSLSFFAASTSVDVSGALKISLSYSASPVGSLSTNYASNIGVGSTTLFNGIYSASGVPSITLGGLGSFIYDPSKGDLLLDVIATSKSSNAQFAFRFNDFPQFQRIYNAGGTGAPTGFLGTGSGLVTQFGTASIIAAPGPIAGAGVPALLALGGGWLAMRRRRFAGVAA